MSKRGGSSALAAMIKQRSEAGTFAMDAPTVVLQPALEPVSESSQPAPQSAPFAPTPVKSLNKTEVIPPVTAAVASPAASVPAARYSPKTVPFSGANKCCICEKTVYKMEEIIAVGRVWHNTCFKCGGVGEEGCKKTLRLDNYVDHNSEPFCTACYSKLFKPKGFGVGTGLNTDAGSSSAQTAEDAPPAPVSTPAIPTVQTTPEVPFAKPAAPSATKAIPATPPPSASARPAVPSGFKPVNETPKCTVCAKSVYKMEEVLAVHRVWHSQCFTCGGTAKGEEAAGCGKTLKRDGYVDHDNNPYCNACYARLFKPKGFNMGAGLNTVAAPAPASAPGLATAVSDTVEAMAELTVTDESLPVPPPPPAPAASPAAAAAPVRRPSVPYVPPPAPTVQTLSGADVNAKFHQAAILKSAVPQHKASIAIGASTAAAKTSDLHKEAGYVGDNDEVDESEW